MGEYPKSELTRVALVDMRTIFRSGVRAVVESEPTLSLIVEADTLDLFLHALKDGECDPDVVVLEIRPGEGPSLRDIPSLLKHSPTLAPVIFASSGSSPGLRESLLAGARGYLDADSARDDIVDALRVAGRGTFLQVPAEPLLRVLRGLPHGREAESNSSSGFARLTAREFEILRAMSGEQSYREIAAEFGLAHASVKKYAHSIITKLGASNRSTAVLQAYRNGLLETDSPAGGPPR